MTITMSSEQLDAEIAALEERKAKLQKLITLRGEIIEHECKLTASDFDHCLKVALHICAQKYNTTKEAMLSKSRIAHIVDARHLCMYLLRELTAAPHEAIGQAFNRDHSGVIYACTAIRDRASVDLRFHHLLCTVRALVQEQLPKNDTQ